MKAIKNYIIAILILSSCIIYGSEGSDFYDIITQEGDVYIETFLSTTAYAEGKIPKSQANIKTLTDSFIILQEYDENIIIMPESEIEIISNNFRIKKGLFYIESESEIKITVSVNGKTCALEGLSLCAANYQNDIYVFTRGEAVRIKTETSGISYLVPPYNKLKILPSLTIPDSLSEYETEDINKIKYTLASELKTHLNKSVKREKFKIFENTEYETEVYRIIHEKKGKNVFIFVPHGDEKSAVNAAIHRISEPIVSGSITIVPIALTPAYENNTRGVANKDLNRQFKQNMARGKTMIERVAYKYASMLTEYKIDLVLTLHEGNGVNEKFKDAIVYDKKSFDAVAGKVVSSINKKIEPTKYKFKTMLYPMENTFTYYAASKGIDSFAIEMTRNLPNDIKVVIKNAIIDEFLKLYGLY